MLDNASVVLHLVAVFSFFFSRDRRNLFLREFLTLLASSAWEKSTLVPLVPSAKNLAWDQSLSTDPCFHVDFDRWSCSCCPYSPTSSRTLFCHQFYPPDFLEVSLSPFLLGTFSFSKNNMPQSTTLLQKTVVAGKTWSSLPLCPQDPSSSLQLIAPSADPQEVFLPGGLPPGH